MDCKHIHNKTEESKQLSQTHTHLANFSTLNVVKLEEESLH